ncbi:nuclear transport factor 2 family protein [Nocardia sp. NBC_00511]|uniref:nuclear transport factor 2 family protein n=1 Tax=Nocardia sp. NBC_00511 TaxID=2903591 RepID=UPI0030E0CBE3
MWLDPAPGDSASVDDIRIVTDLHHDLTCGDLDRVRPVIASEFMMRQSTRLPWGGSYYGPDGFFEFHLRRLGYLDTRLSIEQLFDAGDRIVRVGTTHGVIRATTTPLRCSQVDVFTLRDRKLITYTTLLDAPALLTALEQSGMTRIGEIDPESRPR